MIFLVSYTIGDTYMRFADHTVTTEEYCGQRSALNPNVSPLVRSISVFVMVIHQVGGHWLGGWLTCFSAGSKAKNILFVGLKRQFYHAVSLTSNNTREGIDHGLIIRQKLFSGLLTELDVGMLE